MTHDQRRYSMTAKVARHRAAEAESDANSQRKMADGYRHLATLADERGDEEGTLINRAVAMSLLKQSRAAAKEARWLRRHARSWERKYQRERRAKRKGGET